MHFIYLIGTTLALPWSVTETLSSVGKSIGDGVSSVGKTIGDGLHTAGSTVVNGVKSLQKAYEDNPETIRKFKNTAKDGYEYVVKPTYEQVIKPVGSSLLEHANTKVEQKGLETIDNFFGGDHTLSTDAVQDTE